MLSIISMSWQNMTKDKDEKYETKVFQVLS